MEHRIGIDLEIVAFLIDAFALYHQRGLAHVCLYRFPGFAAVGGLFDGDGGSLTGGNPLQQTTGVVEHRRRIQHRTGVFGVQGVIIAVMNIMVKENTL